MQHTATRTGSFRRVPLREYKKRQTRAAIIASAVMLFNTQGYVSTTIDEIAAAADVSWGTFFNYFSHKADAVTELGRDLMPDLATRVEKQIAQGVSVERIIRRLWLAVDALREAHGAAIAALAYELLRPDGARAGRAAAFPLGELLTKVARAGEHSGQLRTDLDPALFRSLVANLIVASVATRHRTNGAEVGNAAMGLGLNVLFHGALREGAAADDDRVM